jgi:hypothetical protein
MERGSITFSIHALDVLHERTIDPSWVERAVADPDLVLRDVADPQVVHALAVIPEREGRVLRVVYNAEGASAHVVTAFFDRSMRGKL